MKNTIQKIWRFYVDGFRGMTLGKTLWFIILVKLFIMFFILRIFFFPNYLNSSAVGEDKEEYVSRELIDRALGDPPSSTPDLPALNTVNYLYL